MNTNTKITSGEKEQIGQSAGTDYGNWVPATMMKFFAVMLAALAAAELISCFVVKIRILSVIFGVVFILFLLCALYMWRCRVLFDFKKGGLMGIVHQYLLEHLEWDGHGTLLDIGCGAGALTIRCAKNGLSTLF